MTPLKVTAKPNLNTKQLKPLKAIPEASAAQTSFQKYTMPRVSLADSFSRKIDPLPEQPKSLLNNKRSVSHFTKLRKSTDRESSKNSVRRGSPSQPTSTRKKQRKLKKKKKGEQLFTESMLPAVHTKVEKIGLPPPTLRLRGALYQSNDLMIDRPTNSKMLMFCKGELVPIAKPKFKKQKTRHFALYESKRISRIYLQPLL